MTTQIIPKLFLALVAAGVACAASISERLEEYERPSILIVDNGRTDDSYIYLQRNGEKTQRIGLAHALGADTMLVPARAIVPGGAIGFVAISFVSGAVDKSDEITAQRGVIYHWSLGPARGHANLWYSAGGEVALDSVKVCRAPSCRSTTQRNRFYRLTRFPKGRPGWVVDHMKPLECGGEDLPTNMQWQTVAEAKEKDKVERDCSRWLP